MRIELSLPFEFEASHSLSGYEKPHTHPWKLVLALTGSPVEGKLVDMVEFRRSIDHLLSRISNTYLNDNPYLSLEARKFPTCETLSQFFLVKVSDLVSSQFLQENPSLKLYSVSVSIYSTEKIEIGSVILTLG